MAKKDDLRNQREGTVINTTSKRQEKETQMKTKPFNLKEAIQHPERIVDLSRGAYAALDITVEVHTERYIARS